MRTLRDDDLKPATQTSSGFVSILCAAIVTTYLLSPTNASAQAEIVPEGDIAGATDKDVEGWNPSLSVSGTINMVNNTNVVGQVEGTSALIGLGLLGAVDYIKGKQLWRTQLTVNEGFAKTPVIDDLVKTTDVVSVESTYNYFLAKTLGFFGRVQVTTALFNARAITADPVTYRLLPNDGSGMAKTVTSDKLKVASAFNPFTLGYSAGGFAQPLNRDALTLRVRAGFGGRHSFASDVYVSNDDDTTPEVELQELANVHQAGVELFAGFIGKAKEDRLKYAAGLSVLVPFVNNDDFDRSSGKLTRVALEANATVSVFDWMGVTYSAAIVRDPQLFPAGEELVQIQNNLLLTFQYTLIDRKKGLKEMVEKSAIEKAQREKAEAEEKAAKAEEKARALEEALEQANRTPAPETPAATPVPENTSQDPVSQPE